MRPSIVRGVFLFGRTVMTSTEGEAGSKEGKTEAEASALMRRYRVQSCAVASETYLCPLSGLGGLSPLARQARSGAAVGMQSRSAAAPERRSLRRHLSRPPSSAPLSAPFERPKISEPAVEVRRRLAICDALPLTRLSST